MKQNIDWKKALMFLVVVAGLIYITRVLLHLTLTNSFLTTLGVMLILFVGDHFAQNLDDKRRKKREE